jgi:hypothetical protein
MIISANFCDLCGADGIVRLAKGRYWVDETQQWWDACATHLKEVRSYGMETEEYDTPGNVDDSRF